MPQLYKQLEQRGINIQTVAGCFTDAPVAVLKKE
jgi:hypothetical protein